ncbi:MAG: cytochrome c oxidase subunit II [Caldithrix sp.]|nr:MAG: cytochrome c oxidase subunit II [Caldithrix sp.]TDI97640.1 MAG: cytochrome c oxidase subunit II [Caldithrix sp.]
MNKGFQLFPEQASTLAAQVDYLYFFLIAVSLFFSVLIFFLIYVFAVRYRRKSEQEVPEQIPGLLKLEILWSVIPFLLCMVVFVWGATLYFDTYSPPKDALEYYVVGKQWMWHIQHPTGQREINELHVPTGQPIKLTMATEDVIHSFYIPAFRVKRDVVPGRYTSMWFEATKPGEYHLFCAEYCGTKHSQMRGRVVVMEPADYQNWLSGGVANEPLEVIGEKKFRQLACHTCHVDKPDARGPSLVGVFGEPVRLQNGQTVTVDETYIRESILNPNAKIAAGYRPVMPTFKGQIDEVGLLQITAYIKSLTKE